MLVKSWLLYLYLLADLYYKGFRLCLQSDEAVSEGSLPSLARALFTAYNW